MDRVFVIVGVLCFIAAGYFGSRENVFISHPQTYAPHPAAYGAAGGFSVAGGLCMLAGALAPRRRASSDEQK